MTIDDSDSAGLEPLPPPTTDESRSPPSEAVPPHELPAEVLNRLPGPVRQQFEMFAAMGPARSGPDRLLERIPQEQAAQVVARIVAHSDKELDLQHAEKLATIQARERQQVASIASEERRHIRVLWFSFAVIVMGVGLAGACMVLDKDDLAKSLLSLCVGLAGGYGLGRGSRSK